MFGHDSAVSHHITQTSCTGQGFTLNLHSSSTRKSSLSIGRIRFVHQLSLCPFEFLVLTFFFQFLAQPMIGNGQHFSRMVLGLKIFVEFQVMHLALPATCAFIGQVMQVRSPIIESIENMCRVHNRCSAFVALLDQPFQQILSHANIERRCDFIQQQNLERSDQTQQELDTSALSVAQLMHSPVHVDSEHFHEFVSAFGIRILQTFHHGIDGDISHERHTRTRKGNRAHSPITIEVGTVKVQFCIAKGVATQHRNVSIWMGQVTSSQNS
mmetsp:Transcript_22190/g.33871  ORF Transcript_22190/g.33871 Transcript_22190/m.33871 type:complete len:269 (+) Transcript_22190:70-876(+)